MLPPAVFDDAVPSSLDRLAARRESLTVLVYEAIRDGIVSKQLAPGARLSEIKLADQLGVSKTPVREALVRLQAIGLVEAEEARGARVVTPSRERIRHAYEVRGGHEFIAARLAAGAAGSAEVAELQRVAEESVVRATRHDASGFRECDALFHRGVANASANPLLIQLVENSFSLCSALRSRDAPVTGDSIDCAHQHVSIAAAIAGHEQDDAGNQMLRHINKVMNIVLDALAKTETIAT
jgi:GntR family transcriptional regulator, rspAB operon transcriptional repressor